MLDDVADKRVPIKARRKLLLPFGDPVLCIVFMCAQQAYEHFLSLFLRQIDVYFPEGLFL